MVRKDHGKLTVYGGPMFAGKTTELQRVVKSVPDDQVVAVKAMDDDRYVIDRIVNHDEAHSDEEEIGIAAIPIDTTSPDLVGLITPTTILFAIDESNFFAFEPLYLQIEVLLSLGIDVVVAGLIYDIFDNEFGATKKLIEKADEFIELTANCNNCGRAARHTRSLENRKPGDPIIVVGGAEKYYVSCDDCLN